MTNRVIDMLYVSGPFDGTVPADTPPRRQIFTCRARWGR